MRFALALLAAAALAAGVATTAKGLSEPAYIKAANKICSQRAAKLARLPNLSLRKISAKQLAARVQKVLSIYRPTYRQLRALKPPRAFSFLVPRWLHYEALRIGAWKDALGAAKRGKKALARGYLGRSNVLGVRAAEISTGLGLKDCE
ncbi:MAG TPA: hypothetical protein VF895_01385 [Gaiellaceae bacterium]